MARKAKIKTTAKAIKNSEKSVALLLAIFTLFCLANIIIKEIHSVREIKTEDIESWEKNSLICSVLQRGVKRCKKEIRLANERAHTFLNQDSLPDSPANVKVINNKPNIFDTRS